MGEAVLRDALETVAAGRDLDVDTARVVMDTIMSGSASPVQMGALLAALRTKGESADELTGMVESMRDHATRVALPPGTVDSCGTGGDGKGTFNISTAAAIVAAGAGCTVAKHGNRAASSRCGSADVLEALGVAITLPPAGVQRCVAEAGIGFLFAPAFHPSMRYVAPVRAELGIRTIFNVLGPLANPARVRNQAVGVAGGELAGSVALVLQRLGHRHALVFSGPDGVDELGVTGPAQCWDVTPAAIVDSFVDPRDHGLELASVETVSGADASANAQFIRDVLAGERGPRRDVVLINTAAVLVAADAAPDLDAGIERAAEAVDSGAAMRALESLVRVSNLAAASGS